jgi:hypothetical protein
MAQAHEHAPFQVKSLNKSAICNLQFAISSTLRPVFVCTDLILGARERVVGQPAFVDAVPMRVAELFVFRPIAFDRAFVNVLIVLLLHRHSDHGCTS